MDAAVTSEKGASIIEIFIVLVIIGITTLIIMSFTRSTFKMSIDSRSRDAAFMAADAKITELTSQPFPGTGGNDEVTIDNVTCSRSWVITDVNNINRIIVKVVYTNLARKDSITLAGAIN